MGYSKLYTINIAGLTVAQLSISRQTTDVEHSEIPNSVSKPTFCWVPQDMMYCHKALTRVCLRHIGWPARVSWLGLAMTSQWIGRIGREFSYRICQVMQNSPNFETLDIANQDTVMDILMRCGTYVSTICQLQTNRSTQLFFWSMGVLAHWLPLKSPLEAALCFCCRRTRFLRGWRFCKDLAFFWEGQILPLGTKTNFKSISLHSPFEFDAEAAE